MKLPALTLLAGSALFSLGQWAVVVALARTLGPKAVGNYALALALTTPIFAFTSLQLRSVLSTDARLDLPIAPLWSLRLLSLALAFAATICALLALNLEAESVAVVVAVASTKSVESLSDLAYGAMHRSRRTARVGTSLALRGLIAPAVLIVLVLRGSAVSAALAGVAILWLLVFWVHDRPALGKLDFNTSWASIVRVMWRTLPLGVTLLLVSLNASAPRYVAEGRLGTEQLGFLAALSYPFLAGSLLVNSLGQSSMRDLGDAALATVDSRFGRKALRLVLVGFGIGVAGVIVTVLAGQQVLTALYSSSYATHSDAFVWLAVANVPSFAASLAGYSITAARIYRSQVPLLVMTTATTAVGCLVFADAGLAGISAGMLLGNSVQFAGTLILLLRAARTRRA